MGGLLDARVELQLGGCPGGCSERRDSVLWYAMSSPRCRPSSGTVFRVAFRPPQPVWRMLGGAEIARGAWRRSRRGAGSEPCAERRRGQNAVSGEPPEGLFPTLEVVTDRRLPLGDRDALRHTTAVPSEAHHRSQQRH